jgi:hypothetical protein
VRRNYRVALRPLLAAALGAAVSCDRPAIARDSASDAGDPRSRPGYVVDSILPAAEALARFRVGLDSVTSLDGPASRDELFRQFASALLHKDRRALQSLAITRAEYAYLVYPDSRVSRPPFRQPPEVAWLLLQAQSNGSLTKVIARAQRVDLAGYRCESPESDGPVRVWRGCVVSARLDGHSRDLRLFDAIVEHGGRYKFAGFDSDF